MCFWSQTKTFSKPLQLQRRSNGHQSLGGGVGEDTCNVLKSFSNIEPDVCNIVSGHGQDCGKQLSFCDVSSTSLGQHIDTEEAGHSVQVVLVPGHGNNLGDHRLLSPVGTKLLHQLLKVVGGSLSDSKDMVYEPCHAEAVQLLIKEVHPQLAGQKWHVLNDGQTNSPLCILSELYNSWQKRLAELLDPNDLIDTVQVGDNVQTDLRALVL